MTPKVDHDKAVERLAAHLCLIAGIMPVDPVDGGPNWWMFAKEAAAMIDDIRKRFPKTTPVAAGKGTPAWRDPAHPAAKKAGPVKPGA